MGCAQVEGFGCFGPHSLRNAVPAIAQNGRLVERAQLAPVRRERISFTCSDLPKGGAGAYYPCTVAKKRFLFVLL